LSTKASPKIDISPPAEEGVAFRALESVIRKDPTLSPHIKTFLAQHDTDEELFEPSYELCPYIRMDPFATQSIWITEGQHKMDMTVDFVIGVRGLDVVNLMNFWALIRRAVFSQSISEAMAVQSKLTQALILRPEMTLNAYSSPRIDEGFRYRVGGGRIRCAMLINT